MDYDHAKQVSATQQVFRVGKTQTADVLAAFACRPANAMIVRDDTSGSDASFASISVCQTDIGLKPEDTIPRETGYMPTSWC